MSKRKPFNKEPGYVASRRLANGVHVVCYDREKIPIAWMFGEARGDLGQRWVVVCGRSQRDGGVAVAARRLSIVSFPSLRAARQAMKDTASFCFGCPSIHATGDLRDVLPDLLREQGALTPRKS